ncbi:DUF6518 family protein [Agromyces sp. CCNWLW213]|uniref:DUF6518 family protein n=3 Tax=unclassified Agromyces TaxID=2639701 RepID=UPI0030765887
MTPALLPSPVPIDRRLLLPARPAALRVAVVVAAAFLVGGLTSLGQAFLPAEFASLANSASGWTLPTAALVWLTAPGHVEAALGAALGFAAMTVGYSVVSGWRGFPFDPTEWALVGIVVGPVVGTAALALRRGPVASALGTGILAGICVGEGVYGLTAVADTTSPVYWWAVVVVGAALVGIAAARLRSVPPIALAVLVTAIVAGAFVAAYLALPLLFLAF